MFHQKESPILFFDHNDNKKRFRVMKISWETEQWF